MSLPRNPRRLVAAAGSALAMSAALVGLSVTTAPDASADALAIPYRCSLPDGTSNLPLTMDVHGSVPDQIHLGESFNVTDFQVTVHMSPEMVAALGDLDAQTPIVEFEINQMKGDIFTAGVGDEQVFTVPPLSIPGGGVPPADFQAPGQPTRFGPITPTGVGIARVRVGNFHLGFGLGGDGSIGFTSTTCAQGGVVEFATVDVLPAETGMPTDTPTGTPTATPTHTATNTQPGTPTATHTGGTPAPTATGEVLARTTLANTGVAHPGLVTGLGGAMVLLGAGVTYLARRRRPVPSDGPDA